MKLRAINIVLSIWFLLTILGCQRTARLDQARRDLPPDIVGTWKALDNPWTIILSHDGTVSSAVIPMGEVQIRPNKTTTAIMKDDSISTFTAGDCIVEYTPKTRELFVSIEMEKIHVKFPDNVIDGNSIDRFVGTVSEDGKFWMADWLTVFNYGPLFLQDPNEITATPLVFEKMID